MQTIPRIWNQVRGWDLWAGGVVGCFAFGLALASMPVRDDAIPILIAEAAIGVALTSTVFAGLAIFATFFDGAYRKVLELAGGLERAIAPYVVVVAVSAATVLVGTVGALALPALGSLSQAVCIGVSTWLCAWAVFGTVHLASLTRFHASARAELMGQVDKAEALRKRRLRERARPRSTSES